MKKKFIEIPDEAIIKPRCEYELITEKYFGIQISNKIERFPVDTHTLVDFACSVHQHFNTKEEQIEEKSVEGFVWTKANKDNLPKGEEHEHRSIKYKGKPDVLVMIDTKWCWMDNSLLESANFPVKEDSWSAIEWLCPINNLQNHKTKTI